MSKPLVPWPGGKRKLAKHILPLLGDHTCYVEPFAGAGGLYFSKEPSEVEVLNDINGDLTNLYRVVKHHMAELHNQFKWTLVSRDNWGWLKATPVETLTDIQRAARFLYMQKMAFGGKVSGQNLGTSATRPPAFNLLTLERDLEDAHFRLQRTLIESMDWQKLVKRYDRPGTVFYIDPPYWQTQGYGVPFDWDQYLALRELVDSIQGRMIISINNHPDIVRLFKGLKKRQVDYAYTIGGNKNRQEVKELIYTSF